MKISDLKADPKNPRKITDKKLELLKKSILDNGDLGGIVFNKRKGELVGGHQRLKVIPEDAKITYIKEYDQATPKGTLAIGYIEVDGELFGYREVDWDFGVAVYNQSFVNYRMAINMRQIESSSHDGYSQRRHKLALYFKKRPQAQLTESEIRAYIRVFRDERDVRVYLNDLIISGILEEVIDTGGDKRVCRYRLKTGV